MVAAPRGSVMLSRSMDWDDAAFAGEFSQPPSSNLCVGALATRLKNPQRHDKGEPRHADVHPSVPHLIVGNDIGKLRQTLFHTHTPTSDSERRESCVIWLTFVSPLADTSSDLRRADSCDASSSGHPISAAVPRSASLAGRDRDARPANEPLPVPANDTDEERAA